MAHGQPVEPLVQVAVVQLDDTVTRVTHQVVVMALPAEAVAELPGAVR